MLVTMHIISNLSILHTAPEYPSSTMREHLASQSNSAPHKVYTATHPSPPSSIHLRTSPVQLARPIAPEVSMSLKTLHCALRKKTVEPKIHPCCALYIY
ncbi:hypothetical protein BU24DRAFT_274498 [Aaosphaeria arxii CBS 175.79]|uniref:Uncharacterized protein n=1 Tax=Aaosphaeria arxii CBS 175.79 TaxID=1450172 RepID=A0A6A5XHH9_9PLEO|nr:uncharacterized protein BU24DRAFT_274498 [Aaosphaeria arxii CBS 175.79]KAF2012306.1 hypothetical protein BU24DRAFT_274498 [Aaosphaeria arxii CBS 175.79]